MIVNDRKSVLSRSRSAETSSYDAQKAPQGPNYCMLLYYFLMFMPLFAPRG